MTPKTLKIIPCVFALALVMGCSDSNNPLAEDTIDTVPPATPLGVELEAYTGANPWLAVRWADNAEIDLAGYVVQRSFDDGLSWEDVTAVITDSEFVDSYYSIWLSSSPRRTANPSPVSTRE